IQYFPVAGLETGGRSLRRVLLLGALALFVTGCGSASDTQLPNVDIKPFKSDPTVSVSLGPISGGDVTVRLSSTNFKVLPAGEATNAHQYGEGHYHLFLDVPPTAPGEVIPKVAGVYHVAEPTFTMHNLKSGHHHLYVVLGFSDHQPYQAVADVGGKLHGAINELDFTVGPGQTGNQAPETTTSPSPVPSPATAAASPSPSAQAGGGGGSSTRVQVVADQSNGGAYNPGSTTVKVGDTVQWSWVDDSAQHSVTAEDGKFDSGLQGKGSTFSQKFTSAGTFKYKCVVHPQMLGQVTVQ
ncbi:MAG: DUF4399 domain-containing protein, partial [Candidatus Dormibacteraeota bacterium]|nr:DUF4399 domain-containing protein [Candidatus Dormibacteraeota bacterium]